MLRKPGFFKKLILSCTMALLLIFGVASVGYCCGTGAVEPPNCGPLTATLVRPTVGCKVLVTPVGSSFMDVVFQCDCNKTGFGSCSTVPALTDDAGQLIPFGDLTKSDFVGLDFVDIGGSTFPGACNVPLGTLGFQIIRVSGFKNGGDSITMSTLSMFWVCQE